MGDNRHILQDSAQADDQSNPLQSTRMTPPGHTSIGNSSNEPSPQSNDLLPESLQDFPAVSSQYSLPVGDFIRACEASGSGKSYTSACSSRPSCNSLCGTENQRKTVLVQPHEGKKFKVSSRSCLKRQKPPDISKTLNSCRESKAVVLDLSAQDIQHLPSSVFEDMTWLTALFLYEAKLSSLPPSIGCLVNLRHLMLQQNLLTKLPMEMQYLVHLEQLDLRHNRLEGPIPACILKLKNLQQLLLTYNKLSNLDGIGSLKQLLCLSVNQNCLRGDLLEAIGELTRLTQLDLSFNRIMGLPESIGRCRSLKNLNLQHNQLMCLPESMGNLTSLCKLSLKYNQLEELPGSLANCKELLEFNVENNKLSSIPSDLLQNLPKLQSISLSRNQFSTFPSGDPAQFRTCYSLSMDHNQLMSIPTSVFSEASKLTQLNLCENNISFLVPSDLHHWKSIVHLDLGSNQLCSLPAEVGLLENLEVLELNLNGLTVLPNEIQQLSKLRILGLDTNLVECLPDDLSGLISLQELNISTNRLTSFPRSIGSLHKLRVIKAGENDIRMLPPELGNMNSLQELYLNDNVNLNSLPVELSLCKTLKILSLENCPLRDIERNVVEGGSAMIIYFLQQVIQFRHQTTV